MQCNNVRRLYLTFFLHGVEEDEEYRRDDIVDGVCYLNSQAHDLEPIFNLLSKIAETEGDTDQPVQTTAFTVCAYSQDEKPLY